MAGGRRHPTKGGGPRQKSAAGPVVRPRSDLHTPELAQWVCDELAAGKSLRTICASKEGLPSEATVRRWATDDVEGFAAQYARAREAQAKHWADQLVDIADSENGEDTQRAKLRIDTRKWLLSKLLPKDYGERQTIEHEGEVTHHHVVEVPPVSSPAEWDQRYGNRIAGATNGNGKH